MIATTDWGHVRLGEIGQSLIGLTYSPDNVKRSGTLVLRSSNIQDGRLTLEDNVYVDAQIPDKIRVRENDILICVRNGSRRLIGKSVMLDQRVVDQTFGAFMAVFRSAFNPFLRYFFQSDDFRRQIEEHLGATINQITNGSLNSFVTALPSEAEQQVIVAKLEDTDRLIATLERLIVKKQAIKQGVMQRLLTGTSRLPEHKKAWSESTVGDIAEVKTGPFGSSLHERDYVVRGTPIITVEHLGERLIEGAGAPMVSDADCLRLRAYSLKDGDIVFSRVGSIDRNARISRNEAGWLFSGRLLRVRFNPAVADAGFMSAQFHSRNFTEAVRAVAVGQTMPSLNTSILRGIRIDLPPVDEQKAIGSVAEDINRELDQLDSRLRKALEMKQGIMQELLTGSTRLPVTRGGS